LSKIAFVVKLQSNGSDVLLAMRVFDRTFDVSFEIGQDNSTVIMILMKRKGAEVCLLTPYASLFVSSHETTRERLN
jgi:hypothetical protein